MVNELDLKLGDGRTLHVYDTGGDEGDARLAVLWHHGTPNIGSPSCASLPNGRATRVALGVVRPTRIWWLDARPGSGPRLSCRPRLERRRRARHRPVRSHGSLRWGSHAFACGALLPDRVLGVVSMAGLAPFDADGLDWFAGMAVSAWTRCAQQRRVARRSSATRLPARSTTRSSPQPMRRH